MLLGLPNNSRIKISYYIPRLGAETIRETKLLSPSEAFHKLDDWFEYILHYLVIDIDDEVFSSLKVRLPTGGTKSNKRVNLSTSKSIVSIVNTDTLCCVKSILVSLLNNNLETLQNIFESKLNDDELKLINKGRICKNYTQINDGIIIDNEKIYIRNNNTKALLTILAKSFHRIYSIPIKEVGNDFNDIVTISNAINIQINVYSTERKLLFTVGNQIISANILLNNNHYDAIVNIKSFLGLIKKSKCKFCNASSECENTKLLTCNTCFKYFKSEQCFNNHIENKRCIEHSYKCKECNMILKTKDRNINEHICGEFKCNSCKNYVVKPHNCFIKKKELKPSEKDIFYDFETYLGYDNKHIVNFVVTQNFNGTEEVFTNGNDFCNKYISKEYKNYTFIAHNSKGYDVQFILERLIEHGVKPNITSTGNKILSLEIKNDYNIKFIDSLCFTLCALRDFPKTFGLEELHEGYFPYNFNKLQNQDYIGEYPDKSFYG